MDTPTQSAPLQGHPQEPLQAPDDPAVVLGRVKWFSDERGFGFITIEDDSHRNYDNNGDVFVYYTAIQDMRNGRKSLSPGERVAFTYRDKTLDRPITVKQVPGQVALYIQCPVAVHVYRTTQALEEDTKFERARELAYRLLDDTETQTGHYTRSTT